MKTILMRTAGFAAGATLLASAVLPFAAHAATGGLVFTNDGKVFVSGATVNALSGSTVGASSTFGPLSVQWNVLTNASSSLTGVGGGTIDFSKIALGDTIAFGGTWSIASSSPLNVNVTASFLRDISIPKASTTPIVKPTHVNGSVIAVGSGSFTLMHDALTTTVQTNGSTTFSGNGSTTSFANLSVNDKVSVKGSWNADHTVFTATNVRIANDGDVKKPERPENFGQLLKAFIKTTKDATTSATVNVGQQIKTFIQEHHDDVNVQAGANANADTQKGDHQLNTNLGGGLNLNFGHDRND